MKFSRGEERILRKDEWALRRIAGSMIICDKVCLGVLSTSSLLSCDKPIFPG